ncbi:hypothetical protein BH23ACT9_BH23ACT9_16570 [soil metagenome]
MPVFEPVRARRVVATPAALDAVAPNGSTSGHGPLWLRLAPDEVLVIGDTTRPPCPSVGAVRVADPHAIDVLDAGWSGARCDEDVVLDFLSWSTTWPLGGQRPLLLQGMAAGVPVKAWLPGSGQALVLVATAQSYDLQQRWP